ncbi:MAG TPA: hypothetical protein VM493_07775 [Vicinamibacterales bacterium]|nr:hypothetical protein [Vicinamibacterales bacterium]
MKLFGRKWSVQIDRETFDDFDMAFNIVKTTKAEPNTCDLRLYNLNADARGALEGTPLVKIAAKSGPTKHQHKGIPVRISAGYEDADCVIWQGDLRTVQSKREGADWVTELGSGDGEGAYQRSRVNLSFNRGTPIATVLTALAKSIGLGVGNLPLYLPRLSLSPTLSQITMHGIVLSGSASDQLTYITHSVGLEWSIQNGVLQFTERGLPTIGQVVLVSPVTGMVDEPSMDNEGVLTVKMLMIPNVVPGSVIVVASERISGNYRIEKATYEGDTSGQPWYITVQAVPY